MIKFGLKQQEIQADLCVIGGGMAGLSVAITSARLGVKTVLIQERPVLGGNASGEIRMWICGATDYEYREGGILEEIALENYYRNPTKNFSVWDSVLYGKAINQENLTVLMNCTCFDAKREKDTIKSVLAYQMTTQKLVTVQAKYFADCSGDSILAPLVGAEFMYGRESKDEYGETMMKTHVEEDEKTMGNSCLIQARKTDKKIEFHAPEWAEKVGVEKLKERGVNLYDPSENFWYIEIGGLGNVIDDAENLNRRLISLCLGVWDTVKNSGEFDADNFELDFIGFLGAKRESRRMKGDYVLNANDIVTQRKFHDEVAYGGWALDDHYPEGFDGKKGNNTTVVKPYGIPFRSLYSKNIENLFFAGRNISMTHLAMSSARVMGTCTTLGTAVGVGAFVANKYGITPRQAQEKYIQEIQQTILKMDGFLPNVTKNVLQNGATYSEPVLNNGKDRNIGNEENRAFLQNGKSTKVNFSSPVSVNRIRIVFDSDLKRETFKEMDEVERQHIMRCITLPSSPTMFLPKTLAKDFSVKIKYNNETEKVLNFTDNYRRNVIIDVNSEIETMELTVSSNWGNTDETGVFTFEII